MLGECIISSVLSYCNKDLKWRTNVTPQLQLRVLFSNQRIGHPKIRGWADPKGQALTSLGSLFSYFLYPSPNNTAPTPKPALYKLGLEPVTNQEGGISVSSEVLLWSANFSFVTFFWGLFPLFVFFQPPPFWTPFCILSN